MQKKRLWKWIGVVGFLLGLIVCGSLWDYELAKKLYVGQTPKENPFGATFAFIGIIPTFVGWSFLGGGITCLTKKRFDGKKRNWLIAFAVLLTVLSVFYFCNTLMLVGGDAFYVHWAISYPIGLLAVYLAFACGYKLSAKSENENLLAKLIFLAVVSLIVMIIVSVMKELMDRPRFRFVLQSGREEYFKNWWQSGKEVKESFGKNAVSDEFSSFPSGHSAYAMFAIFLFPVFADFFPKMEKHRSLLFALGLIWWAFTALSRLTVGAHYLSDVCFAGLTTIVVYGCANIVKNRKKSQ